MPPLLRPALVLLLAAACEPRGGGPVVQAPAAAPASRVAPAARPGDDQLTACALPWTLETMAEGPGTVIVVCPGDARREPVQAGAMTSSIDPALEPARKRVCECAQRMAAPPFVDLKVTSAPDEGMARVEADEIDDELDAEPARAFYACVGALEVPFARAHADSCGGPSAKFVYPLHVDLAK